MTSGLRVSQVLRGAPAGATASKLGHNADQIAFWPTDENPKFGFVCIENGRSVPGVQRIS